MKDLELEQAKYECDTWKRGINFMMEESVSMKIRLSEILKLNLGKELLEGIDNLQNKLLQSDELIRLFRDDLIPVNKIIDTGDDLHILTGKQFDIKIRHLRHNLLYLEKHFGALKFRFNTYLRDNIKYAVKTK